MSKNWRLTELKAKKNKANEESVKIRVINKAIKDMVRNGHITQQYADDNREKLIQEALKNLV